MARGFFTLDSAANGVLNTDILGGFGVGFVEGSSTSSGAVTGSPVIFNIIGTVRPGSTLHAKIGTRIRHVVVETVTDQNTLTVRLGGVGNSTSSTGVGVEREDSTTTRGWLFVEA